MTHSTLFRVLIFSVLSFSACQPSSSPPASYPDPLPTDMDIITLPPDQLYDKVFGALIGSAIGDAMGAPTEMWSRHQMQVEFGHIEGLDSMVREPSAEGIWDYNLPAGSTTDDTRWKALMVDFFTGVGDPVRGRQANLDAKDFAQLVMSRYEGEIEQLKQIEAYESEPFEAQMRQLLWLKEWAVVAKPFVENDLVAYSDALNRFYGGEMVCAGMLFSPMIGVLYPGDPHWAYQQSYAIDIYDLGYAKDISGLTAAMVAEAMRPDVSSDSVLAVMRHVDPKGYFKSRLVGRSAYKLFQDVRYLVNDAKSVDPKEVLANPPVKLALPLKTAADSLRYAQWSTAYQKLDSYLMRFPFHPAEIHTINLTAMMMCDFDFVRALEFVINYGRDNDTVGAVTGAILGAFHGAKALPQDQVQQVLAANKKLGFDLEAMAQRLVESMATVMKSEISPKKALFDGQSFAGWEGEQSFFRIEEGAIVAGSMEQDIPTNKFLCTEQSYEDFELSLQVKFPTDNNNGGIQIRTQRIPDHHEVIGYQVDVGYAGGEPVWASIYDESRRNKFIAEAPADRIAELLRRDAYNDYRIRCEGPRIQVWFNGEEVIDYSEADEDIDRSGIICVQIHSGPPSEAWYKDIMIQEL